MSQGGKKRSRILLVDDDEHVVDALGAALSDLGFDVTAAQSGERAVDTLAARQVDLVITDLVMGEVDGIGVLASARERDPTVGVILLTGYGDMQSAVAALRLGADDYLLKPCEIETIEATVGACLVKVKTRRRIRDSEGILPVCCMCGKIRYDAGRRPGTGQWMELPEYLQRTTRISVSSSLCPECLEETERGLKPG
jgi:DNA-binding response OmpR family regulator